MAERREKPERENPFNLLPNLKKLSPEFTGIFIILAVFLIIYYYWKPFSSDNSLTQKKKTEIPNNENIPIPLNTPDNTVMIIESGSDSQVLGEMPADYSKAEKTITEIRDYFNNSRISIEEYKKGSVIKTDWMKDSKTGKTVQLSFAFDASKSKIIATLNEKRAEDKITGKIDSRSVYEKISSKYFNN